MLIVRLGNQNSVVLQYLGNEDKPEWRRAKEWWSSCAILIAPDTLKIDSAIFYARRQWLRTYWTNAGFQIKLEANVIEKLREMDSQRAIFEHICSAEPSKSVGSEILEGISLKRNLTHFQVANLSGLLRMDNGANFSVPGAGKTATTLVLWRLLRRKGIVGSLAVICPRSAFETWQEEPNSVFLDTTEVRILSPEAIDPTTELLVLNYEQLENSNRLYRVKTWAEEKRAMLVFDEAHRLKGGARSVRWRAARDLATVAKRIDLLTGTPLPQGLEDLRNLLSLSWRSLPPESLNDTRLATLKPGGIFVRTTKQELGLPPINLRIVEVEMSPIQRQVYSALGKTFLGSLLMNNADEAYFRKRGKAVFSLLAAATNPGLLMSSTNEDSYLGLTWPPREVSDNAWLRTILEEYASHEIPAKYLWLVNFVSKMQKSGKKVLIWSSFVGNLRALGRLLEKFGPVLVHGVKTTDERNEAIEKFRRSDQCSVLLTNPQTLGEGISLHKECHDAVYIDRSYNAGQYLQSLDRIHRLGLPKDQLTTVYILNSKETIDQRVNDRLAAKISVLSDVLTDSSLRIASLPDPEEYDDSDFPWADNRDLADLLDHLRALN